MPLEDVYMFLQDINIFKYVGEHSYCGPRDSARHHPCTQQGPCARHRPEVAGSAPKLGMGASCVKSCINLSVARRSSAASSTRLNATRNAKIPNVLPAGEPAFISKPRLPATFAQRGKGVLRASAVGPIIVGHDAFSSGSRVQGNVSRNQKSSNQRVHGGRRRWKGS